MQWSQWKANGDLENRTRYTDRKILWDLSSHSFQPFTCRHWVLGILCFSGTCKVYIQETKIIPIIWKSIVTGCLVFIWTQSTKVHTHRWRYLVIERIFWIIHCCAAITQVQIKNAPNKLGCSSIMFLYGRWFAWKIKGVRVYNLSTYLWWLQENLCLSLFHLYTGHNALVK